MRLWYKNTTEYKNGLKWLMSENKKAALNSTTAAREKEKPLHPRISFLGSCRCNGCFYCNGYFYFDPFFLEEKSFIQSALCIKMLSILFLRFG